MKLKKKRFSLLIALLLKIHMFILKTLHITGTHYTLNKIANATHDPLDCAQIKSDVSTNQAHNDFLKLLGKLTSQPQYHIFSMKKLFLNIRRQGRCTNKVTCTCILTILAALMSLSFDYLSKHENTHVLLISTSTDMPYRYIFQGLPLTKKYIENVKYKRTDALSLWHQQ